MCWGPFWKIDEKNNSLAPCSQSFSGSGSRSGSS